MVINVKNTEELLDAINNLPSSDEQAVIKLLEGRYEIKETINLIGKKNIKFEGEKDKTILAGSIRMKIQDGENYNSRIKCFDLKNIGIPEIKAIGGGPYSDFWFDYETMKPFLEDTVMGINLYHNNKIMPVSRYPKQGFIGIKEICGKTDVLEPYGKVDGCVEGYIIPDDNKVYTWENEKNAVLVGYWRFDWAMHRQRIESIKDGVIKLDEPYDSFGYNKERGHFYGINLLSELTDEGEWYYDHENEKLYVIPFESQEEFSFSVSERIFEIKNCQNIVFENIIFEETQKTALRMYDCNNIEIRNCVIRNTGSWAVIGENCIKTTISGCTVYSTGGGGIAVDGGDRNTLTASHNIIENNDVSDTGLWDRVYTPGIRISGCGSIVRENKTHDVPNNGILFHGNNHLIEKNEIYNACYEQNDCGGIYSGKDWSCRGNVIRYNHFHDMPGYGGNGCMGLYFDDGFSSAEVYGNLFVNVKTGILIGGGRDFDVYRNMFYNCKTAIVIDDRFNNWANGNIGILIKYLEAVPYKSDIWKKAYPELENILKEEYEFPERTKIFDNSGVCEKIVSASGKTPQYIIDENNVML